MNLITLVPSVGFMVHDVTLQFFFFPVLGFTRYTFPFFEPK